MHYLFYSSLFIAPAEAQLEKIWDQRYGGSSYETIRCVVPLANNDLLISGSSNSGISGDKSEASYGSDDYWIVYCHW
jgi:hypothetical protein